MSPPAGLWPIWRGARTRTAFKAEHGAYKVRAVNDSGFPITATYEGTSGELIRAALR